MEPKNVHFHDPKMFFWARPENGQGGLTDPNYTKVLLTFKNEFVPGDTYPFLTQNWLRRITQLNNTCSFIDIQSTMKRVKSSRI